MTGGTLATFIIPRALAPTRADALALGQIRASYLRVSGRLRANLTGSIWTVVVLPALRKSRRK